MSKPRLEIREEFLIKHTLKLTHLTAENAELIRSEIDVMISIDGVWIDLDKSTIKIAYDASQQNIDEMLEVIQKYGANISSDCWNQWKLNWDRYIDENIKNNAASNPHCCNKSPVRIFRKK